MLVGALERVALHGLGQGQLLLAVQHDGQQGVGAAVAQRGGELARRQRQVDDVLAVPVQDGGDATGATVKRVALRPENGWAPDMDALARAAAGRRRRRDSRARPPAATAARFGV